MSLRTLSTFRIADCQPSTPSAEFTYLTQIANRFTEDKSVNSLIKRENFFFFCLITFYSYHGCLTDFLHGIDWPARIMLVVFRFPLLTDYEVLTPCSRAQQCMGSTKLSTEYHLCEQSPNISIHRFFRSFTKYFMCARNITYSKSCLVLNIKNTHIPLKIQLKHFTINLGYNGMNMSRFNLPCFTNRAELK